MRSLRAAARSALAFCSAARPARSARSTAPALSTRAGGACEGAVAATAPTARYDGVLDCFGRIGFDDLLGGGEGAQFRADHFPFFVAGIDLRFNASERID